MNINVVLVVRAQRMVDRGGRGIPQRMCFYDAGGFAFIVLGSGRVVNEVSETGAKNVSAASVVAVSHES